MFQLILTVSLTIMVLSFIFTMAMIDDFKRYKKVQAITFSVFIFSTIVVLSLFALSVIDLDKNYSDMSSHQYNILELSTISQEYVYGKGVGQFTLKKYTNELPELKLGDVVKVVYYKSLFGKMYVYSIEKFKED
jgi:hypothetical protein